MEESLLDGDILELMISFCGLRPRTSFGGLRPRTSLDGLPPRPSLVGLPTQGSELGLLDLSSFTANPFDTWNFHN